jgi:hypothetical protein
MHSILLAILLGAAAGCQAPATAPKQAAIPAASAAPQQPAREAAVQVAPPVEGASETVKEPAKEALREPAKPKQSECKFLCPESVDLTALVEAPPKPASAEQAKDEAILLWLQDRRTREDESRAWRSLSFDLTWFDEALDARLDPTWYDHLPDLQRGPKRCEPADAGSARVLQARAPPREPRDPAEPAA